MSENNRSDPLKDSKPLKIAVIVKLLAAARGMGKYDGCVLSYRDVIEHLEKALASAEDELTRAPKSELVMGEIITLKKLVAHFAPAPAFYEEKAEQCTERMTTFVEELVDAVNELHASKATQQGQ
jgi:hypothetical protein